MPATDATSATEEVMGRFTPLTASAAIELTRTIVTRCDEVWDLIVLAWNGRADTAMGYASWDVYCAAEFKYARLRIPAEDSETVTRSLRDQGMSTRAIAAATGESATTVRRRLAAVDDDDGSLLALTRAANRAARPRVTGLDGRSHPATRTGHADTMSVAGRPAPYRLRDVNQPPAGGRRARAPGWGLLVNALEEFVNDPAPVAKLGAAQRRSITRNIETIRAMLSP